MLLVLELHLLSVSLVVVLLLVAHLVVETTSLRIIVVVVAPRRLLLIISLPSLVLLRLRLILLLRFFKTLSHLLAYILLMLLEMLSLIGPLDFQCFHLRLIQMSVLIFDEFHDVLRIVVLLPGIKLRDSAYFRDYFLNKYFEQIFCSFLALVHELAHVVQAFLYNEVSKLITHHFFQFFIFFNFGDDLF